MTYFNKTILAALLCPALAFAQSSEDDGQLGLLDTMKRNIKETWASPTRDLYVPLNTWHNRWAYSKEKTDAYNERPWGIGYGVSRFDKDGDWHAIYAMEFQDSHNQIEPIFGYGYQTNWYFGQKQDFRLGLGFTAALTMRHEYDYIPLPLVLPMLSFEYKRFAIQNAYIPGTRNNGNVLFTWARWQFN